MTNGIRHARDPAGRKTWGKAVGMALGLLISACHGGSGPMAPGPLPPVPPGTPPPTYSVSGAVSEMTPNGLVPVEGVLVEEANSRRQDRTGADGLYTLTGVSGLRNSISVSKQFYLTQTRALTISADTRLDIQIDRVASFTLSGVVFEVTPAGRVPIEGVSVYCDSCGAPDGHTFVTTDAHGFYSFDWTNNGTTPLIVRKTGFRLPSDTPAGPTVGWIVVTVTGDTHFDIELVRQ